MNVNQPRRRTHPSKMARKRVVEKNSLGCAGFVKKNKTLFLLTLTLLISILLRVAYIDSIPAGFYIDEIFESYPAHSLLENGKDLSGNSFPVLFDSTVHTYLEPVYIYSTMVSFYFFGVSVFSSRIVAAFYGVLTVLAVFILVRKLFGERVGLLSAAFLAVSPWHSFFSRIAMRWITLPFFFVAGVYFLYRGFEENRKYLVYNAISFSLVLYTYSTARLFVPLFLVLSLLIYWKKVLESKKAVAVAFAVFLLFTLPLTYSFYRNSDGLLKRFNETSIFNPANKIVQETQEYLKNMNVPSLLYERSWFCYVVAFARNYLSYFSPSFLFSDGSQNLRHSVSVFGELYWFELPLILIGIFSYLKTRQQKHLLVLMWLLTFPIPASFTSWDTPHSGRATNAIPVFEILAASGLVFFLDLKTKRRKLKSALMVLLSLLALYGIISYFNYYFTEYPKQTVHASPKDSAFHTNVGVALSFAKTMENDYDQIILTDKCCNFPNHYISFFTGQNVSQLQINPTVFVNDSIGKYIYNVNPRQYCYSNKYSLKTLYIVKDDEFSSKEFTVIKTFYSPDNNVSFKVGLCKPQEYIQVTDWLLCGSFPNPLKVDKIENSWDTSIDYGLDVDYINESSVTPALNEPCGNKTWFEFNATDFLDFNQALKPETQETVAYAHTFIYSTSNKNITLWYGSDDGVKIWLNNKLIHTNHIHRGSIGVTDSVQLELKQGWNSLLIKVESIGGGWVLHNRIISNELDVNALNLSVESFI